MGNRTSTNAAGIATLSTEILALQEKIKKLKTDLDEASRKYESATTTVSTVTVQVENEQREVNTLAPQITAAKSSAAIAKTAVETAKSELAAAQTKVTNLRNELTNLQSKSNTDKTTAANKLTAYNTANETYKTKNNLAIAANTSFTAASKALSDKRDDITRTQRLGVSGVTRLPQLINDLTSLTSAEATQKTALTTKQNEASAALTTKNNLLAEYNAAKTKSDASASSVTAKQAEVVAAEAKVTELQTKVSTAEAEYTKKINEVTRLEGLNSTNSAELSTLQTQLATAKNNQTAANLAVQQIKSQIVSNEKTVSEKVLEKASLEDADRRAAEKADKDARDAIAADNGPIAASTASSYATSGEYLIRPNHYEGQFVKEEHLLTEQEYLDFVRGAGSQYLHQVSGVISGFSLKLNGGELNVSSGFGYFVETKVGFSLMREICLLKEEKLQINKLGLVAGNTYVLTARTAQEGYLQDKDFDKYHFYKQKPVFECVLKDSVRANRLILGEFKFENGTLTNIVQSTALPSVVKTLNGKRADARGEMALTGDEVIALVNKATALIESKRIAGLVALEAKVASLEAQLSDMNKKVFTNENSISEVLDKVQVSVPRYISF